MGASNDEALPLPLHYAQPTFIAEVPAGAQLIAVGLKVLVTAPGMAPHWITPAGLVPLDVATPWSSQTTKSSS